MTEERDVRFVLVELLRCEDAREHRHQGVELHTHQTADDRVRHELVAIDASVDDEPGGHDRIEPPGVREQARVQWQLECAGHFERLDLLAIDHLQHADERVVDDVAMPQGLDEGNVHGPHGRTSSNLEVKVEELLTISEVARRSGVAATTLRFYEDVGLITSQRTMGNQRRYARDVLRRVSFIRAAQEVGLHLREINESLQTLPAERAPTKAEWEAFTELWRPRLDHQIATLIGIRDRLAGCIGCGCQSLDDCEVFNPNDEAAAQGPGAHYLLKGDALRENPD